MLLELYFENHVSFLLDEKYRSTRLVHAALENITHRDSGHQIQTCKFPEESYFYI